MKVKKHCIFYLMISMILCSSSYALANTDTTEAVKLIQRFFRKFKAKPVIDHQIKLNLSENQTADKTTTSVAPLILENSTDMKLAKDIEIKKVLDEEIFQSIAVISHIIQRICPPTHCLVIGIGRSPTPFSAYLQFKLDHYFWNIPLSNFKNGLEEGVESKEDLRMVLFNHFHKYLPSDSEINHRSIVVLDFSIDGETLANATFYLTEYLQTKTNHRGTPKALAILGPDRFYQSGFHPYIRQAILFEDDNNRLFQNLRAQKFDPFAEFGLFNIPKIDKTVSLLEPKRQSSLGYQKLKAELQKMDKILTPNSVLDSSIRLKEISPFNDKIFSTKTDKARRLLAAKQVQYLHPSDQEKYVRLSLQDSDPDVHCAVISTLRKYKGMGLSELFSTFIPNTEDPRSLICFYTILDEIKKKRSSLIGIQKISELQNLIQEKKPEEVKNYFTIPDDIKFNTVFNL